VSDLADDELEGEYEVETIVDEVSVTSWDLTLVTLRSITSQTQVTLPMLRNAKNKLAYHLHYLPKPRHLPLTWDSPSAWDDHNWHSCPAVGPLV
jgi:hypothetical protein